MGFASVVRTYAFADLLWGHVARFLLDVGEMMGWLLVADHLSCAGVLGRCGMHPSRKVRSRSVASFVRGSNEKIHMIS